MNNQIEQILVIIGNEVIAPSSFSFNDYKSTNDLLEAYSEFKEIWIHEPSVINEMNELNYIRLGCIHTHDFYKAADYLKKERELIYEATGFDSKKCFYLGSHRYGETKVYWFDETCIQESKAKQLFSGKAPNFLIPSTLLRIGNFINKLM